jgi:hypothetical protein
MLIPSDGSSFACRSERRSRDMATLLAIVDVPTLAQPTNDECGATHNEASNRPDGGHERPDGPRCQRRPSASRLPPVRAPGGIVASGSEFATDLVRLNVAAPPLLRDTTRGPTPFEGRKLKAVCSNLTGIRS